MDKSESFFAYRRPAMLGAHLKSLPLWNSDRCQGAHWSVGYPSEFLKTWQKYSERTERMKIQITNEYWFNHSTRARTSKIRFLRIDGETFHARFPLDLPHDSRSLSILCSWWIISPRWVQTYSVHPNASDLDFKMKKRLLIRVFPSDSQKRLDSMAEWTSHLCDIRLTLCSIQSEETIAMAICLHWFHPSILEVHSLIQFHSDFAADCHTGCPIRVSMDISEAVSISTLMLLYRSRAATNVIWKSTGHSSSEMK
jgi:hypothetical protein